MLTKEHIKKLSIVYSILLTIFAIGFIITCITKNIWFAAITAIPCMIILFYYIIKATLEDLER